MVLAAELVGDSPQIAGVRKQIHRLLSHQSAARRPAPVLIQGETGTGKGLVARLLHQHGSRARGPFVHVNCAAIPETMLEAELFGYERGAFTDAHRSKEGLVQAANHGVIFLDEIGLLPEALQAKLLTVLEEQAVRRLGAVKREPVDVLVVSATNEDLAAAVAARRFRADLYHRLSVLKIELPALRARGADVLLLAERFLTAVCADYGLRLLTLTPDAREALADHAWPGNVRELSNVIERAALLAESTAVTAVTLDLSGPLSARDLTATVLPPTPRVRGRRGGVERAEALEALAQTGWNVSRAAAHLGVPRHVLRYRIQKFKLEEQTSPASIHAPAAASTRPVPHGGAAGPVPIQWRQRQVTLVRVEVSSPAASGALDTLLEKTRSFGGHIEERNIDSFVASFGLDAAADASRRAALTAIALQRLSERLARGIPEPLVIRIALHSDHAMTGVLDGRAQLEGNRRRRMIHTLEVNSPLGRSNAIVLTDAAKALLDRRFECLEMSAPARDVGRVYELVGYQPAAFATKERATGFVGRDDEIELLRHRFASVVKVGGCGVGIVGEAGVGKSRLAFEFRRGGVNANFKYIEGRCEPYGSDIPYFAITVLLREYFGLDERDDPANLRVKVTTHLREAGGGLETTIPAFFALLDIGPDDPQWTDLEPSQRRQRTIDSLKRLLIYESEAQPLIVMFEDLHWVDSETEAVLASLVASLPTSRILLLATYRPEYQQSWLGRGHIMELRLDTLPRSSVDSLLGGLMGDDPSLAAVRELIIEQTDGNALFIEETVRTLVELGLLVGERGTYRAERALAALPVPKTVEAAIAARIDRLQTAAREVLEAAAVIGKTVPLHILTAICRQPPDELRHSLDSLQAADFIYERNLWPDVEYSFKHSLMHDVAYRVVLEESRRALHTRVVDATERNYPDRLAEHVDRLADHSLHAELWDKAAAYLRMAGTKAFARSAHHTAAARFEQALTALEHLARTRNAIERMIDVKLDLRNVLLSVGEVETILQHLRDATALCEEIGDHSRAGWSSGYTSATLWAIGRYDTALETALRTRQRGMELGDASLRVYAEIALAWTYHSLGRYRDGVATATAATEYLSGSRLTERFRIPSLPSVLARTWLVSCLAELGEFPRAIALAYEALAVAQNVGEPWTLVNAYLALGLIYLRQGEIGVAGQRLDEGLETCQRFNVDVWFGPIATLRGHVMALAGRVDDAVDLLSAAEERIRSGRHRFYQSLATIWLGDAMLRAGRAADAEALAQNALQQCAALGERGNEAYALHLLGDIMLHIGHADAAMGHYQSALSRAGQLEMVTLVGQCHLAIARCARKSGKDTATAEHLAAANEIAQRSGMVRLADHVRTEAAAQADAF